MAKIKRPIVSSPIEEQLQAILDNLEGQTWTIKDLFEALKRKGYPFLMVFLALPFCQPLQIPGFSTPFGLLLSFVGLRMTFGHYIWWPQWILKKQISPHLLKTVVKKSLGFFQFIKPLLHARWSWLAADPFLYRLHGVFVTFMGLFLALPLPIPFSNLLAAWALFILGLGLIEEDGLFVCIGYVLGGIGLVLLGFLLIWLYTWAVS